LGREHYQYVCAKPDENHYDKCLKLQEQFGSEFLYKKSIYSYNPRTLLDKYGYENYAPNPELFLTHLKDGKKLLEYTSTLYYIKNKEIDNPFKTKSLIDTFLDTIFPKRFGCEWLYKIFDKMGYDKMGYNNMQYVDVQKQFFRTLEKNDVLNTMKKMGELSEYTSEYGFYHSKILNLIDDYNSNNNDQCLKINNTFYFEKECEE